MKKGDKGKSSEDREGVLVRSGRLSLNTQDRSLPSARPTSHADTPCPPVITSLRGGLCRLRRITERVRLRLTQRGAGVLTTWTMS